MQIIQLRLLQKIIQLSLYYCKQDRIQEEGMDTQSHLSFVMQNENNSIV